MIINHLCTGEDIVEAAGKMGVLDRLLAKLKARGHRVTLFSQYNRMLDIIEDYLLMRGYRCGMRTIEIFPVLGPGSWITGRPRDSTIRRNYSS